MSPRLAPIATRTATSRVCAAARMISSAATLPPAARNTSASAGEEEYGQRPQRAERRFEQRLDDDAHRPIVLGIRTDDAAADDLELRPGRVHA